MHEQDKTLGALHVEIETANADPVEVCLGWNIMQRG